MQNNQYKEEIFKLFADGYNVPELESKVPVNRRTLYRWLAEFQQGGQPRKGRSVKEDAPEIVEVRKLVGDALENINDQEVTHTEWLNLAFNNSVSGCIKNKLIADKLSDRLLVELEQDKVNLRAVSCYSNAISLHSKLEQSYGNYQLLLNPNLAISVLESQGYIVDNPSTTIDVD